MAEWSVKQFPKSIPRLSKAVLIVGLPGIGNVGKVAVDFMADELAAEKIYEFFSYSLPHSVFVTEENLVELPSISLSLRKGAGKRPDVLFLAGDVQPISEESCYLLSDTVLDYFVKLGGSQVVTIGGIGLPEIPKKPRVYCTGTSKEAVGSYKRVGIEPSLYGVVGPIIGVTGVMLGLSKRRGISAVSLLAETFMDPRYLGIKGAREVVAVLNDKLSLGISIKELDAEIREMESEAADRTRAMDLPKALRGIGKARTGEDVSYIG